MVSFLCSLWPLLLAGLVGWILSGWLGRMLRRTEAVPATVVASKDAEITQLRADIDGLRKRPPAEKIVEKLVEKTVDNPAHVTRIRQLESEVALIAGLRSQITALQSAPPKVVEKIVDRPVEKIVEKIVEKPVVKTVEKIVDRPVEVIKTVEKIVDRPVEKIVEKIVERPIIKTVEKIVEKPVEVIKTVEKIVDRPVEVIKTVEKPVDRIVEKLIDNPAHLTRIRQLESEVAVIAGLRSRITSLEAAPPKVVEKIVDRPVEVIKTVEKIVDRPVEVIKTVEKIVDRPVEKIVEKVVEKPVEVIKTVEKIVDRPVDRVVEKLVPDTKGLEERDRQLRDWQTRFADLERRWQDASRELKTYTEGPAFDLAAAKAAGFTTIKGADDLEIIEGIGPKIAELFRAAGVTRFVQLARMTPAQIQPILDKGGPNFKLAQPETWPEQADLAARNRWRALRSLQDVLSAGLRTDGSAAARSSGEAELKTKVSELERRLQEANRLIASLNEGPMIDVAAAKAAGFTTLKGPDDLEIIEGIGPKIAELLRAAGVTRFIELARMAPAQIQAILDKAGPNYKLAQPDTWPEQAELAARNRWRALKSLQDVLIAGNRK